MDLIKRRFEEIMWTCLKHDLGVSLRLTSKAGYQSGISWIVNRRDMRT